MPPSPTHATRSRDRAPVSPRSTACIGASSPEGEAAGLDPRVVGRIGEALRADYRSLLAEPIPERLADLVRRMDEGRGP